MSQEIKTSKSSREARRTHAHGNQSWKQHANREDKLLALLTRVTLVLPPVSVQNGLETPAYRRHVTFAVPPIMPWAKAGAYRRRFNCSSRPCLATPQQANCLSCRVALMQGDVRHRRKCVSMHTCVRRLSTCCVSLSTRSCRAGFASFANFCKRASQKQQTTRKGQTPLSISKLQLLTARSLRLIESGDCRKRRTP